jgi:hypothetical protein
MMGTIGPKLVFGQIAAPVPEIMDTSIYFFFFPYIHLGI